LPLIPLFRAQLAKKLIDGAKPQAKPDELRDTNVKGSILRVQPFGHLSSRRREEPAISLFLKEVRIRARAIRNA
jgi:hypothetical protein